MVITAGAVVNARHILRAPTGGGGTIDLWIVRVRNAQMGPGIQECRVMDGDGTGSSSCWLLSEAPPPVRQPPLVRGGTSNGSSYTMELEGPADMTHFIVTAGDRRIAVIPIEGEALLCFDGACPADTTVAAWRGDEQIREEPGQFC